MSGEKEAIVYSVEIYDLMDRMDMFGQVWSAHFSYWKNQNIQTSLADKSGGLSSGSKYNRSADKSRIDLDVRAIVFGEKITRKWIRFTAGDNSSALGMANYIPPPLPEAKRNGYYRIARYELEKFEVKEGKNFVSKDVVYTKEMIDYMKEYRIKRRKERADAEKQR